MGELPVLGEGDRGATADISVQAMSPAGSTRRNHLLAAGGFAYLVSYLVATARMLSYLLLAHQQAAVHPIPTRVLLALIVSACAYFLMAAGFGLGATAFLDTSSAYRPRLRGGALAAAAGSLVLCVATAATTRVITSPRIGVLPETMNRAFVVVASLLIAGACWKEPSREGVARTRRRDLYLLLAGVAVGLAAVCKLWPTLHRLWSELSFGQVMLPMRVYLLGAVLAPFFLAAAALLAVVAFRAALFGEGCNEEARLENRDRYLASSAVALALSWAAEALMQGMLIPLSQGWSQDWMTSTFFLAGPLAGLMAAAGSCVLCLACRDGLVAPARAAGARMQSDL